MLASQGQTNAPICSLKLCDIDWAVRAPSDVPALTFASFWTACETRANQREVINAPLSGSDTFTIMPTDGGKSLCFLIPAMVAKGLTNTQT